MVTSSTLDLIFKNAANNNFSLSIDAPKTDITVEDIRSAMMDIVTLNIFNTPGGDVTQMFNARVVNKDVIEFELFS